jgi:hypothetical protein
VINATKGRKAMPAVAFWMVRQLRLGWHRPRFTPALNRAHLA